MSPGAAAAAVVVDRWLGEPTVGPHPVALFGRFMAAAEQRGWADSRGA